MDSGLDGAGARLLQQPLEQAIQQGAGLRTYFCEFHAHPLARRNVSDNSLGLNKASRYFKEEGQNGAHRPYSGCREEQASHA